MRRDTTAKEGAANEAALLRQLLFDVDVHRLGEGALNANHSIVWNQDGLLDEAARAKASAKRGIVLQNPCAA
jgi:hypothetical protein